MDDLDNNLQLFENYINHVHKHNNYPTHMFVDQEQSSVGDTIFILLMFIPLMSIAFLSTQLQTIVI